MFLGDPPDPPAAGRQRSIERGTKAVPKGCKKSLRARRCPAAVDLGIVPGPAGSVQASVENYPFIDQRTAMATLLGTLPKVRFAREGHVPLGAEVGVDIAITGRASRNLELQWSVSPVGEGNQPAVAWEQSRIADLVPAGLSSHLSDFWVPIPAAHRSYEVALRVVEQGTTVVLAKDVAVPTFS